MKQADGCENLAMLRVVEVKTILGLEALRNTQELPTPEAGLMLEVLQGKDLSAIVIS